MPVTHFVCPAGKPTEGEVHTPKHCITECSHQCYSPFLMAAIISSNQRNHHKGKYLSATALTGCARKLQLERTKDYAEHYQNLFYSYRGTVMHQVVEDAALVDLGDGESLEDMGFLSEWRMQVGYCAKGHGAFPIPAEIDPTQDGWLDDMEQVECPDCMDAGVALEDQTKFVLGGTLDGLEPLWNGSRVWSWDLMEEHLEKNGIPEDLSTLDLSQFYVDVPGFDEETGVLYCTLHDLKTQMEYAITYMVKGDKKNKNQFHPQIKDGYSVQANIYRYLAERSLMHPALASKGVKELRLVESHIQAFAMGTAPWTGGGKFVWKDHWRNPLKKWPMFPLRFWKDEEVEKFINEASEEIYPTLLMMERRATICAPEDNRLNSHSWECNFCAFHGTKYCPNPKLEWELLQEGTAPSDAFKEAYKEQSDPPVEVVEEVNAKDMDHIRAFLEKTISVEVTEEPEDTGNSEDIPVAPKRTLEPDIAELKPLSKTQQEVVDKLREKGAYIAEQASPKRQALLMNRLEKLAKEKVNIRTLDALMKGGWLSGHVPGDDKVVFYELSDLAQN